MDAKNQRLSLKEKLIAIVKSWAKDSKTHGLFNIVHNSDSLIIQVFWVICFLASASLCCYFISGTVSFYLRFQVINKFEIVTEKEMVFPTVTICSINAYLTQKSNEYVINIMKNSNVTNIYEITKFGLSNYSELTQFNLNYLGLQYLGLTQSMSPDTTDSDRQALGLDLKDFILACQFNSVSCSESDFVRFYDLTYGNCFQFNSGRDPNGNQVPLKTINKEGPFNALQVHLFAGASEENETLSMVSGVHVYIHNSSIVPTSFEGFDIEPGTQTSLIISKQDVNRLPNPYNECHDDLTNIDAYDSDLYRAIIKANHTYRQQDCYNLCFQKHQIEYCHCYDVNYPKLDDSPPCVTLAQLSCGFTFYYSFFSDGLNSDCDKLCPLECDSERFFLETAVASFPTTVYANYLSGMPSIQQRFPNQSLTKEFFKENMLVLKVYFQELSYSSFDEEPKMSVLDLIASIGGTLGLFLGISFMSLLEVVDLMYKLLHNTYTHTKQSRKEESYSF